MLVATGSAPRRLGIRGEREFFTKGVSYCAVCDGPLYGGKRLMVVGGGNTAVEEALFLTGIASEVVLVHRREELRADRILQERVAQNAKITPRWNEVLEEILGHEVLTSVRVRNVKTQETAIVPTDGLFISIGNQPRSEFLPAEVARDPFGWVVVDRHLQTSVPGIFAAGDVRQNAYRQITFAVGDGTFAFGSLMRYLGRESVKSGQAEAYPIGRRRDGRAASAATAAAERAGPRGAAAGLSPAGRRYLGGG